MNEYQGTWYLRNHSAYISTVRFDQKNGLASEGWVKQNTPVQSETVTPLFEEEQQVNTFFKILNDSTGYVRIKSFDLFNARGIDSVIRANLESIQSLSRLIIDLRNNGGGGDHAMSFLKPLIYTNPVTNIGVDLMTTPDNIAAWEDAINKYRNVIPKKELDHVQQVLDQGKGKECVLINFAGDRIDTLPAVWAFPAKVAIVINRECGSTTEEFLLFAKQSEKVVMAGEHSLGSLDYSNVVHKDFYSPDFVLGYPTTRSRRIDVGLGIDNMGIQPDIPLDLRNNTWLNELLIRF
jgi:C-terminal processing protease CtpA/Prc